ENARDQLQVRLETETFAPAARSRIEQAEKVYEGQMTKYESEKQAIEKEAKDYEREYDRLNVFDDQFDLAEACFTIAIALYGITVLIRKRWLLGFALTVTGLGAALTFAAFMGWRFHPDALTRFFS